LYSTLDKRRKRFNPDFNLRNTRKHEGTGIELSVSGTSSQRILICLAGTNVTKKEREDTN
jgi:hypothetical protein